MKYVTAGIAFVLIWFGTSFLIGLILVFIIKPDYPVLVGVGFDWINLPGTIIGFFAGLHSARATIRKAKEKE